MMIKPGITQLSRYVDSRYTLVTMVAKRARMVSEEQNHAEVYNPKADKPVTVAVNEIAKGKIGYVRSESIRRAKEMEEEKAAAISSINETGEIKPLNELVREAHEHHEAGLDELLAQAERERQLALKAEQEAAKRAEQEQAE